MILYLYEYLYITYVSLWMRREKSAYPENAKKNERNELQEKPRTSDFDEKHGQVIISERIDGPHDERGNQSTKERTV